MKTARRLSVFCLLAVGLPALYGGIRLVLDPTGSSVRFPFSLLNGTIFHDYYLIGWIALTTVGLFSLLITASILYKTRYYSFCIMLQGVIICIYAFIMMLLLQRVFLLGIIFLLLGALLIILGLLQYQRKIVVEMTRKNGLLPKKQ